MRISRHAKNNMKLYGISEDDVAAVLETPDETGGEGGKTIAMKRFKRRFSGYPLKVVYDESGGEEFIITVYPLKRKAWR